MQTASMDFVIPWVDGSDPEWRREKAVHSGEVNDVRLARWVDGEQRYRDWGLLKYWFRGVEKFAPWVNRIHFITWGHLPAWLNANHPKLHIVNHRDYIPAQYLPTFSSRCIELNIHRIKGLADRFVYFNDDMYLTAPVKPTDFFRRGLPCDAAIISPIRLERNGGGTHAEINDVLLINGRFRKNEVLRSNPLKWFSPRYGVSLIRTLTQLPFRVFTGFYVMHQPVSYLKSTFDAVWREFPDALEAACRHRFRDTDDVNQWIMQYWQYCMARFAPRSPSVGLFREGDDRVEDVIRAITGGRRKLVCWNDSPDVTDEVGVRVGVAFEKLLPGKSGFEKS